MKSLEQKTVESFAEAIMTRLSNLPRVGDRVTSVDVENEYGDHLVALEFDSGARVVAHYADDVYHDDGWPDDPDENGDGTVDALEPDVDEEESAEE